VKDRQNFGDLTLEALIERENDLRKTLLSLRMDLAINKLKNYRSIRYKRRELAKVLTFINQKKKAGSLQRAGEEG
jgi:ribosomal protein L29